MAKLRVYNPIISHASRSVETTLATYIYSPGRSVTQGDTARLQSLTLYILGFTETLKQLPRGARTLTEC